jgi:hypothetical protein
MKINVCLEIGPRRSPRPTSPGPSPAHRLRINGPQGRAGRAVRARVGEAESYLFDAAELVEFAVKWLERMFGGR